MNKFIFKLLMTMVYFLKICHCAYGQTTLSGKVTDGSNAKIIAGVSIKVTGHQIGTMTNDAGVFSISVPRSAKQLSISYVGYKDTIVEIGLLQHIDISLMPINSELDEVVVIGYGTQKKSDLTGSVSSVNGKVFEGRNISSFEEGMQGQTAGVNVVQGSGQPGGRTIVRVRGQNSILGGNDPLYVVDGVPIQNESDGNTSVLSTISPDDIQTIDVLKDASATAIYGARGSNGVVLITTKRGKSGFHKVDVKSILGTSQVIKKLDMLSSEQFVQIANERAVNDGTPLPFPDAVVSIHTDWQDVVFRTAMTNDHSVNFSGGNEQTQYFASGSFFDQDGILIGSGFKRGSFRLNLDQKMGTKLSFSSQMYVSKSIADRSQTEDFGGGILMSALGMPPINTPRDESGNYTPGDVLLGYPFSDSAGDNPLILANEVTNTLASSRFLGNFRARYAILPGLNFEVMVGTDFSTNTQDTYSTRLVRNVSDGTGGERRTETNYYIIESMFHYNKELFDGKHVINATAGFTWESQKSEILSASASGFVTDDFGNKNLGAGERYDAPVTDISEWDIVSFLARINYSINNRYLFTVSGRRDGSSRFGDGNKWGFFPSAAFAWKINEEDFIKDADKISDFKLRLSWGKTGNQAITPYQSLQRFETQSLIIGGRNVIGFAPANLGNPSLKWETTNQVNAGLDFGLDAQRYRFTLDYYYKKTDDLLALVNLPPSSGFATNLLNIGAMENKGLELNTGIDIIREHKDWSWNVNFNIGFNRNKIISLAGGSDVIAPDVSFVGPVNILRVGQPLSAFYGYQEDGLTDNGLIKYKDQNGDNVINSDDRVMLGSPFPDFTYGVTNQLSFKRFDLSVFIQGEQGKDLWNANKYYNASSFYRGMNNVADVVNRWSVENPDPSAPYPKATATLNMQWSDRFVENASFLRVKNIQIGYNLKLNHKIFKTSRIFVSGQNLWTISGYSWYDPDVNAFASGDLRMGIDNNTFPVSKTFTFGVNLGF